MRTIGILAVFLFFLAGPVVPQTTPTPSTPGATGDYEELPELKASEILRQDMLNGPHHKVREEVPTFTGMNRFTIDSPFGVFEAEGNEMLVRRVTEIDAIARLKEVSRTDVYKEALLKAAKVLTNQLKISYEIRLTRSKTCPRAS